MIEIGALQVRSFVLDELAISWQAELDPDEDINDFEFRVLRSLSPEDGFEAVSPGLIDTYAFVDRDVNTRSKWRKFYYKVEATHTPTGMQAFSKVANSYIPTGSTLIGLEIARRERILLSGAGQTDGYTGVPCMLFVRRTFGPHCPECWDSIKKKVRRSNCVHCYGTGRYLGYMNPISVRFQIEPHSLSEDHTNIGKQQHALTSAWTSNYPLLTPGDIVVEVMGNRRWRIETVTPTEQLRVTVRQIVKLFYLDESDIQYRLEMPNE